MIYTVVTYRWGWLNSGAGFLAATQDADRACELAEEESRTSGGKNGVLVLEWTDDETAERYAYYPSSYGEKQPEWNRRIDMFESMGRDAHEVATSGTFLSASREGGPMIPVPVEVPAWLQESAHRREAHRRFLNELHDNIRARHAQGLAPFTTEENAAWCAETTARIDVQVRELLEKMPGERERLEQSWRARNPGKSPQLLWAEHPKSDPALD